MSIEIHGYQELRTRLQKLAPNVRDAAVKQAGRAAMDLLGESARRAPVKEGHLRGSGSVQCESKEIARSADKTGAVTISGQPQPGKDETTFIVGFDEPYALRQHEELGYVHPMGGEAKYLERPFLANRTMYAKSIAAAVAKAIADTAQEGGGS